MEVVVQDNESLDRALRRFKRKVQRSGLYSELRKRRYYEKPSVRKRRKMKVAKFTQMLKTRHAEA